MDESYVQDGFNLTNLNTQVSRSSAHCRTRTWTRAHSARGTVVSLQCVARRPSPPTRPQVPYYDYALDMILDIESTDEILSDDQQEMVRKSIALVSKAADFLMVLNLRP